MAQVIWAERGRNRRIRRVAQAEQEALNIAGHILLVYQVRMIRLGIYNPNGMSNT